MEKEVRILIVDDHYFVRAGIKQVLSLHFPKAFFGETDNGQSALQAANSGKWNAIILDLNLPGRGGLDALKELKASYPNLPVIILSMHAEDPHVIRAVRLGACAYIVKDNVGTELVKATEAALRGERYLTGALSEKLANYLQESRPAIPHEGLSEREFQVLLHIGAGKTVKEIAYILSLSVKTISTYRSRILEKMSLKNNSEVMRYAVKHGLINL